MLKIVNDSVLKVSRSPGYDIVPLRETHERDFALHLGQLLSKLEIDCVLDVGANVGQYRDFLRDQVLYRGTIVSFEPVTRHAFKPPVPEARHAGLRPQGAARRRRQPLRYA